MDSIHTGQVRLGLRRLTRDLPPTRHTPASASRTHHTRAHAHRQLLHTRGHTLRSLASAPPTPPERTSGTREDTQIQRPARSATSSGSPAPRQGTCARGRRRSKGGRGWDGPLGVGELLEGGLEGAGLVEDVAVRRVQRPAARRHRLHAPATHVSGQPGHRNTRQEKEGRGRNKSSRHTGLGARSRQTKRAERARRGEPTSRDMPHVSMTWQRHTRHVSTAHGSGDAHQARPPLSHHLTDRVRSSGTVCTRHVCLSLGSVGCVVSSSFLSAWRGRYLAEHDAVLGLLLHRAHLPRHTLSQPRAPTTCPLKTQQTKKKTKKKGGGSARAPRVTPCAGLGCAGIRVRHLVSACVCSPPA